MVYFLLLLPVIGLVGANYKAGPLDGYAEALTTALLLAAVAAAGFAAYSRDMTARCSSWMLASLTRDGVLPAMQSLSRTAGLPRLGFADRMLAHKGGKPADILADPLALLYFRYVAATRAGGFEPFPVL